MRSLLAPLCLLACTACTGWGEPEAPLGEELQTLIDDRLVEMEAPGATLAVVTPEDGLTIVAAGLADVEQGIAMTAADRFGIGSITKTFTAAVVLQLEEEGALSRDDLLSAYRPDFPRAEEITLRHLLSHTSGIYDVAYDPAVIGDPGRAWDPEDLVALAEVQPLEFEPGDQYGYSNTNFHLLGLVIEEVTGESWAHQVRTRLLDPFELADTFIASDEEVPAAARGYFGAADWTMEINPKAGWAAGAMVSNGADIVRWLDLLLHGDVLSAASREAMQTRQPVTGEDEVAPYGLGLRIKNSPTGEATKLGHGGDAIVYRADAFYNTEARITVVAMVNGFPHEARDISDATWELLLE